MVVAAMTQLFSLVGRAIRPCPFAGPVLLRSADSLRGCYGPSPLRLKLYN